MNSVQISDLEKSIDNFVSWLENHGYASYDPYDIWGIPYSLWARKLYYKKSILGLPFIAPILFIDTFLPGLRCVLVKKERFATADAQLILAFINLYKCYNDKKYLDKAQALGKELLSYSIPGYSGYCWGYPFDWQHSNGLNSKNTPLITTTPYCFEAFLALHDVTGEKKYIEISLSIAQFILKDLNDTKTSETAAAGSYTPFDSGKVINASAYRAMVLVEAGKRFGLEEFLDTGIKNLNFIIESQNKDGSWLYALDSPGEKFIDHFHTCFVLKNLYKINKHLKRGDVENALKIGYKFYRDNFFSKEDKPLMYTIAPRTQIVSLEMYNYAECITMCSLFAELCEDTIFLAEKLAAELVFKYQVKNGHYVTRVFKTGHAHKFPFIRWPQAQLFYAMTNLNYTLLKKMQKTEFPIKSNATPTL